MNPRSKWTAVTVIVFTAALMFIQKTPSLIRKQPATPAQHAPVAPVHAPNPLTAQADAYKAPPAPKLEKTDVVPKFSEKWLTEEARRMNRIDDDPKKTERILYALANQLTARQVKRLQRKVLDERADANERHLSLYLMRMNDAIAVAAFKPIALLKNDFNTGHHPTYNNTVLALGALEEIEERALVDRTHSKHLADIAMKAPNPMVAKIAYQLIQSVYDGKKIAFEVR